MTDDLLMIATEIPPLVELASSLRGAFIGVPDVLGAAPQGIDDIAAELDAWRDTVGSGPRVARVVVAVWLDGHHTEALAELSPEEFSRRAERPFAVWYAALGAAVRRCADGGVVVAVVERPAPLDCAGFGPESGIADAIEALVRSLARSEGPRGVRINAVTTPYRLSPQHVPAPAPPLASFPGRLDVEVSAAVTMVLGDGVAGVTGSVVHADCGRSWR